MAKKTTSGERKTGATRRKPAAPQREASRFDRWLDDLVSWTVAAAILVGGVAIVVTLLWGR